MNAAEDHPSFVFARSLPEPWRTHFAKSAEEVRVWQPVIRLVSLAPLVRVVMRTRVECAWAAYCGAVPGFGNDDIEVAAVLDRGDKLPEAVARALFPEMAAVPYAE